MPCVTAANFRVTYDSEMANGRTREKPADLIVMGSHGRRGLARMAMGSQAAEVFRESPVPVLLIRAVYP